MDKPIEVTLELFGFTKKIFVETERPFLEAYIPKPLMAFLGDIDDLPLSPISRGTYITFEQVRGGYYRYKDHRGGK